MRILSLTTQELIEEPDVDRAHKGGCDSRCIEIETLSKQKEDGLGFSGDVSALF